RYRGVVSHAVAGLATSMGLALLIVGTFWALARIREINERQRQDQSRSGQGGATAPLAEAGPAAEKAGSLGGGGRGSQTRLGRGGGGGGGRQAEARGQGRRRGATPTAAPHPFPPGPVRGPPRQTGSLSQPGPARRQEAPRHHLDHRRGLQHARRRVLEEGIAQ